MPPLTSDRLITPLEDFVRRTGESVDLLLVRGLALQAYGYVDRVTQDVDGEIAGNLEPLATFLREHEVPADLGENMSGWAVVAMPPGYRDRATLWIDRRGPRLRLLAPTDFIIAKLRRGTDLDLDDARFVAHRFGVTVEALRAAAASAVAASPNDTALFIFRKTVESFCSQLADTP